MLSYITIYCVFLVFLFVLLKDMTVFILDTFMFLLFFVLFFYL